ncbi:hypothetical protein EVAR_19598_1 [Eumeta japonica]|uniref:Uncharacterized protein n=1 Tax=Eumeta variegata TaxID=151549 RepID=A0A4C1UG72_EUMVA|nr:hypothetical protein EVAR_19598_1 [Eumeta japonica]
MAEVMVLRCLLDDHDYAFWTAGKERGGGVRRHLLVGAMTKSAREGGSELHPPKIDDDTTMAAFRPPSGRARAHNYAQKVSEFGKQPRPAPTATDAPPRPRAGGSSKRLFG